MSARYDDFDNDDFDGEDNSPAGLRKALKKAQAEAKAAKDAAAAAEERATKAEQAAKKSTLQDVLSKKGLKPGLVRFLEQDGVEATGEAVDAWVKENGEFFNIKAEDEPQGQQEQQEQASEDQIPADLAAALEASQRLDQSGVSPSDVGTMQRIQSLSTDPKKASFEDLVASLKEAGAPLV